MLLRLFSLATAIYLRLTGARRRRLDVGEVSLVYYRLGPRDGEPWLLLHGMGSVAASWRPLLAALRRGCRLLVPELSALGGTQAPGGGLAIAQGATVMARLLEEEFGGRPATVVGLSLGGWMAVRLALARPDLVARLVLIDGGGYRHQNWDRVQRQVTLSNLAGVDRIYRALFVHIPWLLRVSRRSFLQAYTSPGVRNILTGTAESDTFDDADLARLTLPTALIWGERDGIFRLRAARAMAAALPNATLQVLPGCGHAVHLECPGRMVAAVQAFRRETSKVADAGLPQVAGGPAQG
ncbi:MAG TPA: alpha/beta hydrolase [Thermoanaerobaculia bacterium]|nr:alpha/beta hydrolase [Thermoanaerobaculia bacterium]